MKFGKSLSSQVEETLPGWRDKFLSYKELKKKLKLIESKSDDPRSNKRPRLCLDAAASSDQAGDGEGMSTEEMDFVRLLEDELEKFNTFFVEKEEEYVIRLKELQDRVEKAKHSSEAILKFRKEMVDFHGEMVLLENYSALNYTGLVKILKKYDKRTGALLRFPFIQRVLQQPFFTTDLLYKLVKQCEMMLDHLFLAVEKSLPSTSASKNEYVFKKPRMLGDVEGLHMMKSTISALRALKQIRSGSSTVSVFSLPPLQLSGLEDAWKKIPLLEQVAK